MRLAIFGTGGFGRELLAPAVAQRALRPELGIDDVVFVDDEPSEPVLGHEVLRLDELRSDDLYVLAIGSGDVRRRLAERCAHLRTGGIVAPTAVIGPDVDIAEGAVFCDFTMVTASARIGRHFQCNIYSYVAHDCEIGDFVTFAPRVCCNGNIRIEDGAYIGTGAVLKQGTRDKPLVIGAGATVGMGAVVTKSVAPGATVVGNPARPLGA